MNISCVTYFFLLITSVAVAKLIWSAPAPDPFLGVTEAFRIFFYCFKPSNQVPSFVILFTQTLVNIADLDMQFTETNRCKNCFLIFFIFLASRRSCLQILAPAEIGRLRKTVNNFFLNLKFCVIAWILDLQKV